MDLEFFLAWLPQLLISTVLGACLWIALRGLDRLVAKRWSEPEDRGFLHQLFVITGIGLTGVLVIIALPVDAETRGQLLSLFGLVVTVLVAFSSTTLVSNAMGGLMLRAVGNLRAGDYVEVDGHVGRVTERGLFHTEIQNEDRDLTTLPNQYLITHPFKVKRHTGTVISALVTLGYDVPRLAAEAALLAAAEDTELKDPFVQVLKLGDFTVHYRIAGFQADVSRVLSQRSRLRVNMLDSLHAAGIEIVSPNFMNQRILDPAEKVVARPPRRKARVRAQARAAAGKAPEDIVFDKAEAAAAVEQARFELNTTETRIDELEKQLAAAKAPDKPPLEEELDRLRSLTGEITARIDGTGVAAVASAPEKHAAPGDAAGSVDAAQSADDGDRPADTR